MNVGAIAVLVVILAIVYGYLMILYGENIQQADDQRGYQYIIVLVLIPIYVGYEYLRYGIRWLTLPKGEL